MADPSGVGKGNEAPGGHSFAAVGAEGDVIPVAHTGVPALGAYDWLMPYIWLAAVALDDLETPISKLGEWPQSVTGLGRITDAFRQPSNGFRRG